MQEQLTCLPVRPAPVTGHAGLESLTSWLFRLAVANGFAGYGELLRNEGIILSPHALVDLRPERWGVLSPLSQLSGIAVSRLRPHALDGSLTAMTGTPDSTAGRWLMSSGGRGCRYSICAACVSEHRHPHWLGAWRLTVRTFCPLHLRLMVDTCQDCGGPLVLSGVRAVSLGRCEFCGKALRDGADPVAVRRVSKWRAVEPQDAALSNLPVQVVHSKLWWDGVRVILNVLGRPRLAVKLKKSGVPRALTPTLEHMAGGARLRFDQQPVAMRHGMLDLVDWLTKDWPGRFVETMNKGHITCGEYATAEIPVPYWLWSACKEHLDRKRYRTTAAEISAVTTLLGNAACPASKVAIKRLLGVTEGKALDAIHPVLTRRLTETELLAVVQLLNADLAATPTARDERASLLRDASCIAAATWLGISLKAAAHLELDRSQLLLTEWRHAARSDDSRGRLARSYLEWMQGYLHRARVRFERYGRPQGALFLTRFGVASHGFGLAARFADLLRRCGVSEWKRGSRLLTADDARSVTPALQRRPAFRV